MVSEFVSLQDRSRFERREEVINHGEGPIGEPVGNPVEIIRVIRTHDERQK
jgi:hypothetical protein